VNKRIPFRLFKIIGGHSPDPWNEEMNQILRILGMNLYVYREYAEQICTHSENTWNAQKAEYLCKFETKIENILGHSSRAYHHGPRWVCLAKLLKTKNLMEWNVLLT
jgi:hypothetical protein